MRIVKLILLKKYHSLAAKGETVDLSTLEETQQANAPVDAQQQNQQNQHPPNEAVNPYNTTTCRSYARNSCCREFCASIGRPTWRWRHAASIDELW
jgi:hypothetical protein